jgi:hypothetical protein
MVNPSENMLMNTWTYRMQMRAWESTARAYSTIAQARRGEIGYSQLMGSGWAPRTRATSPAAIASPLPTAQAQGTTLRPDAIAPTTTGDTLWPLLTMMR